MAKELAELPDADFTVAAYEFFGRGDPTLLSDIPQSGVARFFAECRSASIGTLDRFKAAIIHLHERKDLAYGAAWKRRGERVSILPNIARKVDRLEQFVKTGAQMVDESVLDTAVDLYVYTVKYRLFLAERQADGAFLPVDSPRPLSDHFANFDAVVAGFALPDERPLKDCIVETLKGFENLWQAADRGEAGDAQAGRADTFLLKTASVVAAVYRGVVPTHDGAVVLTVAALTTLHPRIAAMLDGDGAGDG